MDPLLALIISAAVVGGIAIVCGTFYCLAINEDFHNFWIELHKGEKS